MALLLALPGCAALPWPRADLRASPEPVGPLLDLRGVVHVHTRVSHDSSGTPTELIDAAHAAGLRWIALTEHTRHATLPPTRGLIEGVRVIPGYEASVQGGSILALGVRHVPGRHADPADLVREIHAAGGVALLGHAESSRLATSEAWAAAGLDGFEVFNLHAVARERPLRLVLGSLFLPAPLALRALRCPDPSALARWQAVRGADSIVGGVDAHAKARLLGRFGGTFDRYRDLFRVLTTHVLATDASESAILDALRAGRSYLAFEGLRTVPRFTFERVGNAFRIDAPEPARLVLSCDGHTVSVQDGRSALVDVPADAEACHAEAWLDGCPWVVTSRIRLRR